MIPANFQTIHAAVVREFGPPKVISVDAVPKPFPGPGEVLVRVKAAGVGPWDGEIRSGRSAVAPALPLTLGSELSGVVEGVGRGVTDFRPGELVFGVTNPGFTGAYAEVAAAQTATLAKKPKTVSDIEAASLPVVAVTAYQMLFEIGRVSPGQRVLVLGAAGDVGSYAVQLAHRAAAEVIAVVEPPDAEYARALGADVVLVGSPVNASTLLPPVDLVIDTVGGSLQRRSVALLCQGGRLISAVAPFDPEPLGRSDVRADFLRVEVTRARLERIAELIERGDLSVHIARVLPLAAARHAHEILEGRLPKRPGQIVLKVAA
jgi:NADPH:quinone reductase-like Zn-dependent oxidoreductase